MIWFYRIIFIPALLLAMPYYGMRMLRRGGYAKDFAHRFGCHQKLPKVPQGKKRIWIQAVSVGEIEAISALVEKLSSNEKVELVITTTTSTGYKILREKYASKCQYVGVFPIDFWLFSKKAWNAINPSACILMEGELWPEHLHQAKIRNVKVILINARMSDKSFNRYSKLTYLSHKLFEKFSLIAASSEFDMTRLIGLGAPKNRMVCTGNLKFDASGHSKISDEEKTQLRKELGFSDKSFVLLGSSTWAGEEEMLIEAAKKLKSKGVDCRLLLVPRHAERRNQIIELIKDYPHHIRSQSKQAKPDTFIYLADTTGELRTLTQVADLAFVGKSLPPNMGGQTPIDCAALSTPMIYGPNMSNFRKVCQTLEHEQAAIKVPNAKAAIAEIVRVALLPELRKTLAESAKQWHESNIGATDRVCAALTKLLHL